MLKNVKHRLAGLVGILLVILSVGYRYSRIPEDSRGPSSSGLLPKEDKEQLIVDPQRHLIVVVKPTGNETLYLPDRPSVLDIRKDGTVKVTSAQWGFEHRLFLGIHGAEAFRLAAGLDMVYLKRLDLGFGIASEIGTHTPVAFMQISYNFWSNCRVGIAYGTNRYVGGTLTVRL